MRLTAPSAPQKRIQTNSKRFKTFGFRAFFLVVLHRIAIK